MGTSLDEGASTTDPSGGDGDGDGDGNGDGDGDGETRGADCWTHEGDLELMEPTQADLDAFEDVCEITGNLRLRRGTIEDLSPLSELEVVRGFMWMHQTPDIETLAPLASLREVGGGLAIVDTGIDDLEGLGSLERVGSLTIGGARSIKGLPDALTLAAHDSQANITLRNVTELVDLTGLPEITVEGIEEEHDRVTIGVLSDDALVSLEGIERIVAADPAHAHVWVSGCHGLTDLGGLSAASELAAIYVENSDGLTDLSGLDSLQSLGALTLSGNASFSSFSGAPELESLDGLWLGSCTDEPEVGGNRDNPLLENFTGLETVAGLEVLEVHAQTGLASLTGLSGALELELATFRYNPLLDAVDIEAFLLEQGLDAEFDDFSFCGNLGQGPCNFCPPID